MASAALGKRQSTAQDSCQMPRHRRPCRLPHLPSPPRSNPPHRPPRHKSPVQARRCLPAPLHSPPRPRSHHPHQCFHPACLQPCRHRHRLCRCRRYHRQPCRHHATTRQDSRTARGSAATTTSSKVGVSQLPPSPAMNGRSERSTCIPSSTAAFAEAALLTCRHCHPTCRLH